MKTKAIRVDPGMFYPHYSTAKAAVAGVLADVAKWKANSIFVFAFSPIYGAYYKTTYKGAWATSYIGKEDFLRELLLACPKEISVVASFRMNHYQEIAKANPGWRALNRKRQPYVAEIYGAGNPIHPLSAHSKEYARWFEGLLRDAVQRLPGLDGLEACEGNVAEAAESDDRMPDFNAEGLAEFARLYPNAPVEGPLWQRFRADGLTDLHRMLRDAAGALPTYYVHDLPTQGTTRAPFPMRNYALACGFDWLGIARLGYKNAVLSAIWQQREQEAIVQGGAKGTFDPKWTSEAILNWKGYLPTGVRAMGHVEVTPWPAAGRPAVTPTPAQFKESLKEALEVSEGVTVYSYDQLKKVAAGKYVDNDHAAALKEVFSAP